MGKYLFAIGMAISPVASWAQRMIKVSGTVMNVADKKHKVPFTDIAVHIFSCKTVAEAEDLSKQLKKNAQVPEEVTAFYVGDELAETDANGYYEILVPDNGALVFKAGMNEPVLEKVKHRMQINVEISDGIMLENVLVTAKLKTIQPEPKASRLIGNRFYPYNSFVIPENQGNTYSRLIIQPYVLNCENNDTVAFLRPLVYDGKEFHRTQLRKMGYDWERDPLAPYVNAQPLTDERMLIEWQDTVVVPDAMVNYSCYADFCIEDYNNVPFRKLFQLNTCENKRPLKFLDYQLSSYALDLSRFPERAQVEKHQTEDQVELSFEISSDQLTDDPKNQQNLNRIGEKLKQILNEPGAMLKEFHLIGTASPEGSLQLNQQLAEKRMKRVQTDIMQLIPAYLTQRIYQHPQAKVASWMEVVDLMEADGKLELAEQIREVLDRNPGQINAQGKQIRQLATYKKEVVPYLERLRQVKYKCSYDIYREPTDEEVLAKYRAEGLQGLYTRYEYWKLFQMLNEGAELEALAKKAYQESLEMKQPWVVPGNLLATSYLKRDTVDTQVLEPLIDRTVFTVNYERTNPNTGRKELVNPIEVVANQLTMYIRKGDFENASVMAKLIPDSETAYQLPKAYAWALGGYFRADGSSEAADERAHRTFETICQSSDRNAIVMYLALETPEGNQTAEQLLSHQNQQDALTWYLKAIVAARKGDAGLTDAALCLSQAFARNSQLKVVAQNDGEFNKDLIEMAFDLSNNQ